MSVCRFCEIYERKEGIIYENELFFAQYDKFPVSPGHTEIIPIRHTISLFDLGMQEVYLQHKAIFDVKRIIENTDLNQIYKQMLREPISQSSRYFCHRAIRHKPTKPDGYNIGINEGRAAGRTIDHLHTHIIPRYVGDVEDPIGGIRNVIPGMGDYRNIKF
ncbi:HIT family protein [archaeon]|jgi:diadenosine tetraphosphate (Ap4A) HIT family hydrolase|nr:HIT family protein [archaeon]MBT3582998.1 HIT family protein [Candidatus Woesearchaeota archaeon]MBT6869683.1 HIT family protein [archaeon]MBT7193216.1 HIT family protein [archaeon]MBT7380443.1 HIT family protein [archaeon]